MGKLFLYSLGIMAALYAVAILGKGTPLEWIAGTAFGLVAGAVGLIIVGIVVFWFWATFIERH